MEFQANVVITETFSDEVTSCVKPIDKIMNDKNYENLKQFQI